MKMLYVDEREKPMSLQIFGGSRETLVRAAEYVDQYTNADIIDINRGCPVPKITKNERRMIAESCIKREDRYLLAAS